MWLALALLFPAAQAQDTVIEAPTLEDDRGNRGNAQDRDKQKSAIFYAVCEDMYDDVYGAVYDLKAENDRLKQRVATQELRSTALVVTFDTPRGADLARIYPGALVGTGGLAEDALFADWEQDIDLLESAPTGRCLDVYTADLAPAMAYDNVPLQLCDGPDTVMGQAKEPPNYIKHVAYAQLLEDVRR